MDQPSDPALAAARELLAQARDVVAFTGAGISAESGVPTFRGGDDSLWSRFAAERLASPDGWREDPELVWGWYLWRMARVREAQPNAGHIALAQAGIPVVTQNVDDLHERAGSEDVVHLHGELFAHRCFACARPHADVAWAPAADAPMRVAPPRCTHCGGRVRPGVVWFGEDLPQSAWNAALARIGACDVLLVVGTSSLVHPAAGLSLLARERGARIIEVNPQSTPLSADADVHLALPAATALPLLPGMRKSRGSENGVPPGAP